MRRAVLPLAVIVLSCGSPRVDVPVCAPQATPVDVVPPSASAPFDAKCGEELAWLRAGDSLRLRIHMTETGHGGAWEASAYFEPWGDGESSVVVAVTYRRYIGDAVFTDAQTKRMKSEETEALFAAFRKAAATPPAAPAIGDVLIEDSSRTLRISVDVGDDNHRATFEVDDAQVDPPSWRLRGCPRAFPRVAQHALVESVTAMTTNLGIMTMLDALRQRAKP